MRNDALSDFYSVLITVLDTFFVFLPLSFILVIHSFSHDPQFLIRQYWDTFTSFSSSSYVSFPFTRIILFFRNSSAKVQKVLAFNLSLLYAFHIIRFFSIFQPFLDFFFDVVIYSFSKITTSSFFVHLTQFLSFIFLSMRVLVLIWVFGLTISSFFALFLIFSVLWKPPPLSSFLPYKDGRKCP